MKNTTMAAAAQNAINGINLDNSIKKTFNDYADIQQKTTDDKVINKPTTLNELVDYFCNDDDYACMVLNDVESKKAPLAELLDIIRCGLLERAIVMTGEEPQEIEPYTILAMNIVNNRISELYGIEGFDMQPVIDEFGEDKYNEYSDIAEDLLYELDV